ncbi:AcvB/VirJ family lysyl-phosphatidylglycerol hydrolase [Hydrocarboniphaga sp.]|uniref:virulence factor family protein n=1 Tax=Hydrocarboniphaga sp. TaxID=2033016 RepID=UPI00261DA711|nr:AcvB/VirJ family lysyl-phosphatidylglycerol hydrolase [Hydrocarboniphaga sp.]
MLIASLLLATAWASPPPDPARDEVIDHGRFEHLHLYKPEGPARSTALLFSGNRGWDRRAEAYARALRDNQTLVAGIDTPALLKKLSEDGDDCEFLDGDLDNLSRFIQAYTHQDDYLPALLLGFDDAAALVFGVLAQAPAKSFSGGVGVGFCPRSVLHPPLCAGTALRQHSTPPGNELLTTSRLQSPFYAVITPTSEACGARAFIDQIPNAEMRWPVRRQSGAPSAAGAALVAYGTLAADIAPAHRKPEALPDLPLVEIPATANTDQHRDLFAVLISGDGGWAGLDEEVADTLAAAGIPVVGMDSLRYFWTERQPEDVAKDLDRLVAHYTGAWKRPNVMLIGYSQGADVLPFTFNRLADATRSHVVLTSAVALSEHAAFEFHVGAWAGQTSGLDTLPEINRLAGRRDFQIVCGQEDEDAICPKLDARRFEIKLLPGSHHFDGNYDLIAQTLIDGLPAAPATAGKH